jgi:hypothetical protein
VYAALQRGGLRWPIVHITTAQQSDTGCLVQATTRACIGDPACVLAGPSRHICGNNTRAGGGDSVASQRFSIDQHPADAHGHCPDQTAGTGTTLESQSQATNSLLTARPVRCAHHSWVWKLPILLPDDSHLFPILWLC